MYKISNHRPISKNQSPVIHGQLVKFATPYFGFGVVNNREIDYQRNALHIGSFGLPYVYLVDHGVFFCEKFMPDELNKILPMLIGIQLDQTTTVNHEQLKQIAKVFPFFVKNEGQHIFHIAFTESVPYSVHIIWYTLQVLYLSFGIWLYIPHARTLRTLAKAKLFNPKITRTITLGESDA